MGERRVKIEVSPEVMRQIATRRALGASLQDLEKEFGYSRPVITRTLADDISKAIIKGVTEDAVAGAVVYVRRKLADLGELAVSALEHNLKQNKMEAVKEYFAMLGAKPSDSTKDIQRNQQMVVILPGAKVPKDVVNEG